MWLKLSQTSDMCELPSPTGQSAASHPSQTRRHGTGRAPKSFGQTASVKSVQADEISSEIHDLWFDADALPTDSIEDEVHLPLYQRPSSTPPDRLDGGPPDPGDLPSPEGVLAIRSVRSVTLEDRADIGWYSINRVEFDPVANVIRVECNQPLTLTLSVSELDSGTDHLNQLPL